MTPDRRAKMVEYVAAVTNMQRIERCIAESCAYGLPREGLDNELDAAAERLDAAIKDVFGFNSPLVFPSAEVLVDLPKPPPPRIAREGEHDRPYLKP